MGLSSRDAARERQLANLQPGRGAASIGNRRSLVHGGRATAATLPVEGKSRAIFDQLAQDAPLRGPDGELPPADRVAVELLALTLCRLESIAHHLEMVGLLDGNGDPRAVLDLEGRLRREAMDHAAQLGLTPKSRVALGIDLARGAATFDLARALAELPDDATQDAEQ